MNNIPDDNHQQNMEEFGNRFDNTRDEVITSAKKTGELTIRAVILACLIIGGIIMAVVTSYNYAYHDPDDAVRRDTQKNAAKYAAEAEDLLRQGRYTEFMSYLYSHEIQYVRPEEFEHLRRVRYVADEYYNCIKELEEIVLRSDDPEYFDGLDSDIKVFCMYADSFYEVYGVQRDEEENAECRAYIDDMKAELEAAMKAYFSMDDDELEEFLARSEVQKAVKLEEIFRHE